MVGVATGLAEAGFIPFVYSIVTFATLRPYEFIRNGPSCTSCRCASSASAAASSTAPQGATHHGLEDVGVMRVQPGMTGRRAGRPPADGDRARARRGTCPDPSTTGSARTTRPIVPGLDGRFTLGRRRAGRATATTSADRHHGQHRDRGRRRGRRCSAERGVRCERDRASPAFSPAPLEDLAAALARVPVALTVEAHYATGGLGSLVAEVIAERGLGCRLVRCGVQRHAGRACPAARSYLYRAARPRRATALVATALGATRAGAR